MKKAVVIFESRYGFTKRYAEWISEALACPLAERSDFRPKDFASYDIIIYGGGLYAGGVSGIRLITENWDQLSAKKTILFTCGVADPDDPDNVSHIREALSRVLTGEMMDSIEFFHLRGGIDYRRLHFVHRAMMSMLRRMLLKKAEAQRSREDRQLLETYGKKIDFTERESIQPLIDYIRTIQ